jgi:hypothetical protein
MKELLKAQDQQAIVHLVDQMNAGRFSDTDAQRLIEPLGEFALKTLSTLPSTPARDRLWIYLTREQPHPELIVFKGYWVRSDAGWGRIDEIRHGETGPLCEFFFPKQETPYLVITLRAESAPEIMHLDLSRSQWYFPNTEQVYICTHPDNCKHFISIGCDRITKDHNRATHSGLSASFKLLRPAQGKLHHILEYRAIPPQNPFE